MKESKKHECSLPDSPEASMKFRCVDCGAEFEWASDCVYGFPCVENPHDFSPDRESCTPAEIAFWEDAKQRWDAGEGDVRGARCETVQMGEATAHVTRTSWGIGANSWEGWEQITEEEIEEIL